MSVTINGTTGITTPGVVYEGDANINGVTVGRGAGAVASNTAVGASALAANTTGAYNTAVGYSAASTIATGNEATAIGWNALQSATGNANTAVGSIALWKTTTGVENTAVGKAALTFNTTGSYNVAVGKDALISNTTASNNTAVGYQAGYSNVVGGGQTFIGRLAGYNSAPTTANTGFNTAVGNQALTGMTTGIENTAVGDAAGYYLTTGTYNSFFGAGAGFSMTTGSKNTILGSYNGNQGGLDIRTANNYIVLSDGDGNPRGYYYGASNQWKFNGAGSTSTQPGTLINNGGVNTIALFLGDPSNNVSGYGANDYSAALRFNGSGVAWGDIAFYPTATSNTAGGIFRFTADGSTVNTTPTASIGTTGVAFPATQVASSDANTLDDYEEGTWTPAFAATGHSFTYLVQQGWYRKVGSLVTCGGYIRLSANPSGSGTVSLSVNTLPFTAINAASAYNATTLIVEGSSAFFTGVPVFRVNQNTYSMNLYDIRPGQSPASTFNVSNITSSMEFEFQFSFATT